MSKITDLIISPDMREYLSKQDLSIQDQLSIILFSVIPMKDKIKYFKKLEKEYPDSKIIKICIDVFSSALDFIYSPPDDLNCFYVASISEKWANEVYSDYWISKDTAKDFWDVYSSFSDVLDDLDESYEYDEYEIIDDDRSIIRLDIYNNINHNIRQYISCDLIGFDNQMDVVFINNFDPYFTDKYSKDEINEFEELISGMTRHLAFPFDKNEIVKFQTPDMENPIFGHMVSEADGNGTMYCFLYGVNDETNFMDFSYILKQPYENFVPYFNYITRASDDEIKTILE